MLNNNGGIGMKRVIIEYMIRNLTGRKVIIKCKNSWDNEKKYQDFKYD